ncbi:MAG: 3'-5' exonuclease, partial [Candidatus Marinimicrobia bacterium]|nr:3'-5' exonuclease [Candidatus Neomarinimicrobiota bacterium]
SKEYKKILQLNRILSDINNQPISKEIIFLTEVSAIFMNKDNAYYKYFLGSNSKWIDSDYKKTVLNIFNDEFKIAFPSEIVNSIPNRQDYESILIFKSLIKLYFDFEKIHNEYKDKRNYLTFNDVLILTNKILEDERVCEKYRDLYSHIMIDEFQDTNDLRWNIIRKIASDKNGKLRENGLFVVGDIKQSIYGFANADVKIMDIARNEIIKSNGDIVDFNNNFRSSENYIENVINKIFPNVMLNSENERESYEAFFEPTEIADANQSSQNIETNTNICATVGLCRNNSEEKNEDIEILQTVKYVKDALKWADKNKQNLEKNNGPIIAVLLRKFTKIQNYLKIFQQYNIDFEIVTSKGLFNKQEAYDIFHFISIMVNPYDDVALIGLLRSPFFALSDYDIHDLLSKRGKEKSVYEMVNSDKKFQYISKEIVKWRNLLKEYSIDKLLNKIISSNDCKLGYFSEVGGRQRLANFDKILNIISQLVLDGVGLNAIYDFFKFQIQQKTDISEAELPSVKKVQIMTMHKAKGLEFPVVILPDLAGSKNSDKSRIKIGEIKNNKNEYMQEIGISLVDEYDETKKSNLLYRIKKYDALKVEAEEKRLFYVTITRAIYKIYLLADTTKMKDKSKAQNWWNTFIRDSYNVPNEFSEKSIEKNEKTKTAIEKYFIDDIESEINQYEDNKKTMEEKWVDYKTLKWNKKYNSFNPHDIMDLIFPNEKYSNSTSDTGEFNRIFGIIFHKVMEMKWWDLEEDRDKIEKYIELEYPEISREKVIVKLKSHLEKLRER